MLNTIFDIVKLVVGKIIFSYLMKIGFILLFIIGLGTGMYYMFS
jgi:hypothetical protein